MTDKYCVNVEKFTVAAVTAIVFILTAVYNVVKRDMLAVVICLALAMLFMAVAAIEGSTVKVSSSGVGLYCFGRQRRKYTWEQIQEVGVAGVKIFNGGNTRKTGTKYIYFSSKPMTDKERFEMCLKWPPGNIIFMKYNYEKICKVQTFWSNEIKLYNAGDVEI